MPRRQLPTVDGRPWISPVALIVVAAAMIAAHILDSDMHRWELVLVMPLGFSFVLPS